MNKVMKNEFAIARKYVKAIQKYYQKKISEKELNKIKNEWDSLWDKSINELGVLHKDLILDNIAKGLSDEEILKILQSIGV